jgi:hypothetical protein
MADCPKCGGKVHREIARDEVRKVKTVECEAVPKATGKRCGTKFDVPIEEPAAPAAGGVPSSPPFDPVPS